MPGNDAARAFEAVRGNKATGKSAPPFRIAVDARDLLIEQRTGVERVVFHFVEELAAVRGCEFVLFLDAQPPGRFPADARHEVVVEPRRLGLLHKLFDAWIVLQIPRLLRHHRIDAFFSLNTKFPVGSGIPSFATVHGVEWYFYPRGYRIIERVKQRIWFELCSRYCAGIVTFAQNSRSDILRIRPSCRVPVRVVPEGCDPKFRELSPDELAPTPLRPGAGGPPYILSVCSLVPRKNIDGLLHAYARLVREHAVPHRLALVGKSGWKAEILQGLVRELKLGERVRFLGFVSDAELVQLYNQAALFVYPSKYEGFGLPLIEAMRCGVPVVTANRSATAEVAGDAAVLVDPFSAADLAAGMHRALTDGALRVRLIRAGHARAAEFSWERMAREICNFILSAAACPTARELKSTG